MEQNLIKELKSAKNSYTIFLTFGVLCMVGSGIMAFIALITDGELILGLKIKEHFFMAFYTINLISLIFILAGKMELKKDRIKTFLFLQELNKRA